MPGMLLQVLIFSQFKIMLDVLEDYLRMSNLPLERIDGSVAQRDRQVAIDRFSKGEHHCPAFVDRMEPLLYGCMQDCSG